MNNLLTGEANILAALSISVLTILVLLGVVAFQYSKIRDLRKPRYGFLGKPLAVALVGMLSVFTITGYGYYNANYVEDDVSVSDPVIVPTVAYVKIEYTPINERTFLYRFNAIPVLDGVEWGTNSDLNFSVSWTIENNNRINKEEAIVNKNFPGGVIINLDKGLNVITAQMNIDGKIYVESINLRI